MNNMVLYIAQNVKSGSLAMMDLQCTDDIYFIAPPSCVTSVGSRRSSQMSVCSIVPVQCSVIPPAAAAGCLLELETLFRLL